MELMCGITGLNAERLKELREKCKGLGFKCSFEKGGWLSFKEIKEGDWKGILGLVEAEVGILPMYFKMGGRVIGLEYGRDCIKASRKVEVGQIGLQSIYGIKNVLIGMRINSIKNVLKEKNGKN